MWITQDIASCSRLLDTWILHLQRTFTPIVRQFFNLRWISYTSITCCSISVSLSRASNIRKLSLLQWKRVHTIRNQWFIQAVPLMSLFEKRLSFWMLYFFLMLNNHEIILKPRWGSIGAVRYTVGPWQRASSGSGDKTPEKFWPF